MRQKIKFNKDLWTYLLHWKKIEKDVIAAYNPTAEIPKIIHCVWFGGKEYPKEVQQCMETWKEHLQGYTIKIWNEDTFPVHQYKFVEDALAQKKWAFAADVARIHALYHWGDIFRYGHESA